MPQRPGLITSKRSALLWQVLTETYIRLGFDVIDDEAFAQLVLARIIEPTSKADSVRVLTGDRCRTGLVAHDVPCAAT